MTSRKKCWRWLVETSLTKEKRKEKGTCRNFLGVVRKLIWRRGSPQSTARSWQNSVARTGYAKARAMYPSPYPREVSYCFVPILIPFVSLTSSGTEHFCSRDANLEQPSVTTPLPWHLRKPQRSSFLHGESKILCSGDIQLAHLGRRASRHHVGWFAGEEVSFTEMAEKRTQYVG